MTHNHILASVLVTSAFVATYLVISLLLSAGTIDRRTKFSDYGTDAADFVVVLVLGLYAVFSYAYVLASHFASPKDSDECVEGLPILGALTAAVTDDSSDKDTCFTIYQLTMMDVSMLSSTVALGTMYSGVADNMKTHEVAAAVFWALAAFASIVGLLIAARAMCHGNTWIKFLSPIYWVYSLSVTVLLLVAAIDETE